MPCRFTFKTVDEKEYVTIFKHGDDPRQDQLILQIISLMDKVSLWFPDFVMFILLTVVLLQSVCIIHGLMKYTYS